MQYQVIRRQSCCVSQSSDEAIRARGRMTKQTGVRTESMLSAEISFYMQS